MKFPYMKVTSSMDSLEIEDPGNCAIRGFDDLGQEHIIIIDTQMGMSRFFTYGPILPDINSLPSNGVQCKYYKKEYKNTKVNKAIEEFLNNTFPKISQAEVINREEALKDCRSIIEYMKQFSLF